MQKNPTTNKTKTRPKIWSFFFNEGLILFLCFLSHQPFVKMPEAILCKRRALILTLIQPEKLCEPFVFHEAHTYFLKILEQ